MKLRLTVIVYLAIMISNRCNILMHQNFEKERNKLFEKLTVHSELGRTVYLERVPKNVCKGECSNATGLFLILDFLDELLMDRFCKSKKFSADYLHFSSIAESTKFGKKTLILR